MTILQQALALSLLATQYIGAVVGDEVLRLSYHFAFEDEGLLATGREPTQAEVEAVLCESNVFFSKSFQETFQNPKIAVVTRDADFVWEDYQFVGDDGRAVEMPSNINFTMDIRTTDGSTPPSFYEIQDALPNLDYNAYLTKYVWKSAPVTKNFFFEARGLIWRSIITDEDVSGSIPVVDCPEGAQPEAMVEGDPGQPEKEEVDSNDYSADNGFALKLGFYKDHEREPTDLEWEALVCEVDRYINLQLKTKLNDPSISSYASMLHWEYDPKEYLPAQLQFTISANSGNGTEVPTTAIFEAFSGLSDVSVADLTSQYISKAFPVGFNVFAHVDKIYFRGETLRESDPASTLLRATCPVTIRSTDLASFDIKFEFEDEVEREPTPDEIEAMMCEVNLYFQKTLRDEFNDPSIVSKATNIDWTYNAADQYSFAVSFTALTLYGDGSHVKAADVFDKMKNANVQLLSERYILNSIPLEQNIFYFAQNLYFNGNLGREIPNPKLPNGVACKRSQDYADTLLPRFEVQIGFESRTGIPTEQDVKGLMCQTNLFFEKRLREELEDSKISSHATSVDWDYVPGADLPAVLSFTPFSTYGDGSLIPGMIVYDVMKEIDIDDYVRNYVWLSEPYEVNIFWDTRDIEVDGEMAAEVKGGKLARVTCVAPRLDNASPEVAGASGPATGEAATKKIEDDTRMTHLQPHE